MVIAESFTPAAPSPKVAFWFQFGPEVSGRTQLLRSAIHSAASWRAGAQLRVPSLFDRQPAAWAQGGVRGGEVDGLCAEGGTLCSGRIRVGVGGLQLGCALQMWVLPHHNGASYWELRIQIRSISREPGGVTAGVTDCVNVVLLVRRGPERPAPASGF